MFVFTNIPQTGCLWVSKSSVNNSKHNNLFFVQDVIHFGSQDWVFQQTFQQHLDRKVYNSKFTTHVLHAYMRGERAAWKMHRSCQEICRNDFFLWWRCTNDGICITWEPGKTCSSVLSVQLRNVKWLHAYSMFLVWSYTALSYNYGNFIMVRLPCIFFVVRKCFKVIRMKWLHDNHVT